MIIAQITDLHIKAAGKLAYRKVDTVAGLSACVAHLNGLNPRPDAAVVTGDLGDFGTPAEYAIIKPILDNLAMPFYVIPGNHDEREAMRQAFADHAYLPSTGHLHYAIEQYPIRLIGLDTLVPGEPFGNICPEQLDWLENCLSERPDVPTLVFMHHPPFLTGIRHMDWQNCRNNGPLGELIKRNSQVQMIVCGHVHRAIETSWAGTIASIGPSPCHSVALDLSETPPPAFALEPPACRLVHLNDDSRLIGHLTYIGSFAGPYPFFNRDGSLID